MFLVQLEPVVFLQKTRDTPYEERRQILGISMDRPEWIGREVWQVMEMQMDITFCCLHFLLQVGPRTHRSRPETPCNSHIKSHINSLSVITGSTMLLVQSNDKGAQQKPSATHNKHTLRLWLF